jgi:glutathione S-transferase
MNEVVLYQPPTRPWGTPNMSPFCAKLETYLRMTEIPYRTASSGILRGAPKGKIPWVELDGTTLGDSQLVIEELERRLVAEGKRALDGGLSPRDAALARVVRRTIEEAYYFVGLYARWQTDAGYEVVRDEFRKLVPAAIAVPIVRRAFRRKLHQQGTGRHAPDEAMAMGAADLEAIAELLGDKPFVLGDAPHVVDCALYAFVEAALGPPIDNAVRRAIAGRANLVDYRARIRGRWWKDLPALA